MKVFIIFITLLSSGCVSTTTQIGNPIDFTVDNSFTPYEQKEIISVCNEWNDALERIVFLCETGNKGEYHYIEKFSTERMKNGNVLGTAYWIVILGSPPVRGYIQIKANYKPYDLKTIVRHELGHLLGLEHEEKGLMYPTMYANQVKKIDKFLIRKVYKIQRW